MWWCEHTEINSADILVAIEHYLKPAMKTLCTKSLVFLVVAVATVRSYVTLAAHTQSLPRHLA